MKQHYFSTVLFIPTFKRIYSLDINVYKKLIFKRKCYKLFMLKNIAMQKIYRKQVHSIKRI